MVLAHCSLVLKGEGREGLWRVGGKGKMDADIWLGVGRGGQGNLPALGLLSPEELGVKKTPAGVSSRVC